MYSWIDHESEMELSITADGPEMVMSEALVALGELWVESTGAREGPVELTVTVSAPDRPALLAEWLSELVFLAETEGFAPERVVRMELTDTSVDATVAGHRSAPQVLIKGVTYHRLEMREEDEKWTARVVFDV